MVAAQVLLVGVVLAGALNSAFAILDVGPRGLRPVCDPFAPGDCTSSDDEIQQHAVATLEADGLVTGEEALWWSWRNAHPITRRFT